MEKKLIVAYDVGKLSQKALEIAIELARDGRAIISIITSVKIPDVVIFNMSIGGDTAVLEDIGGKLRNYYENKLEEAASMVKKEGIPVQTVILQDKPGKSIVQFAEKEKADLILIGAHNSSTIGRLFLGSVSNYVVQHAKCPVLVIKA